MLPIAICAEAPARGRRFEMSISPRLLPHQIDRLRHYFLTYKSLPGGTGVEITHTYGRDDAREVIERSREDYAALFPDLKDRLFAALTGE
jgi:hypothetical protein